MNLSSVEATMDYKLSTVIFKPQEFKSDNNTTDEQNLKKDKDVKQNVLSKDETVRICQRVVDEIQENYA